MTATTTTTALRYTTLHERTDRLTSDAVETLPSRARPFAVTPRTRRRQRYVVARVATAPETDESSSRRRGRRSGRSLYVQAVSVM